MAQAGPSEAPRRDESLGGQRAGWRRPRFPSSPSKCVVVSILRRGRGTGEVETELAREQGAVGDHSLLLTTS